MSRSMTPGALVLLLGTAAAFAPGPPTFAGQAMRPRMFASREVLTMSAGALRLPAQRASMLPFSNAVPFTRPKLTEGSTTITRSTLGAAAGFLIMMHVFQMAAALVTPAGIVLLAHGCANALGGIAALISEAAVFGQWREALGAVPVAALSKAVNAVSYVSLSHAVGTLASGASGVALAAAGTGVVATLVQSVFHAGSRAKFLQTNLVRNIVFFETYWLTWAGISALSPAIAASYTGVAVAGAACGFAAAAASALAGLRWSWRSMTQALRSGAGVRAALSSSVLFVVYQGVIDALI